MKRFTGFMILSFVALLLLSPICATGSKAADALSGYGDDEALSAGIVEESPSIRGFSAQFTKYFVTTDWVKARLGSILVIDTRSKAKYDAGHIKGAINVPSSEYFVNRLEGTDGTTIHYMTPTAPEFIALLNEWGVKSPSTVVVTYGDADDMDWGLSTRLVWTLKLYGHANAFNMEGGFPKWQYIDKYTKFTTTVATSPKPNVKSYVLTAYSDILATKYDVLHTVDGTVTGTILFDTRTPNEYNGTDVKSGNPRSGHVKGAVAFNWTDVFTDNAKKIKDPTNDTVIKVLKTEAELKALFKKYVGVPADKKVIMPYCEGGFRSAHVTHLLLGLGYPTARHYQGSWSEWSRQDPSVYLANTGTTP